ncbi:Uncharacterised protein [Vibrio cholerae]|nr:Uncharacterised protein [Vibrio cholerae]
MATFSGIREGTNFIIAVAIRCAIPSKRFWLNT